MTVAMQFHLNFKSGKPVYLQVVDQVKAAAAAGALRTGEPLPSIRPLAETLRVNRNTVAKAYAELESQGVIETIAGKGCFVRENHSPLKKTARVEILSRDIDEAVPQPPPLRGGGANSPPLAGFRSAASKPRRARPPKP